MPLYNVYGALRNTAVFKCIKQCKCIQDEEEALNGILNLQLVQAIELNQLS